MFFTLSYYLHSSIHDLNKYIFTVTLFNIQNKATRNSRLELDLQKLRSKKNTTI